MLKPNVLFVDISQSSVSVHTDSFQKYAEHVISEMKQCRQ